MSPLMGLKLLPSTETCRADIDSVACFTHRVGTFDTNGMSQVANTAIALDIEARLIHD